MFGGIHPASRKENTRRKPLMLLEHPPAQVALPLAFHGGPSSLPLVKAGERVYAGQPIARPEGEDGAVLHASVSGRVEAIRELPTPGAAAPPPSSSPTMGTIRPGQSGLRASSSARRPRRN